MNKAIETIGRCFGITEEESRIPMAKKTLIELLEKMENARKSLSVASTNILSAEAECIELLYEDDLVDTYAEATRLVGDRSLCLLLLRLEGLKESEAQNK